MSCYSNFIHKAKSYAKLAQLAGKLLRCIYYAVDHFEQTGLKEHIKVYPTLLSLSSNIYCLVFSAQQCCDRGG